MLKGKSFTFALVIVLMFAVLAGTTSAGAAPKSALSVTISADKSGFTASDAVLVNVTISNTGKNPVKVLIDASVLKEEEISTGSGVRNVAIILKSADLRRVLAEAQIVSLTES